MDYRRLLAVPLATLLLAGCAARTGVPGGGARVASATAAGVEVVAATGAWTAWPDDLGRLLTPVRVEVTNQGQAPVRLDVTTFALALPAGGRLAALLPADVRGVLAAPPPAALSRAGLTLGPTRERSGPGWAVNDPQPDPRSDPTQEPQRTWQLPSGDMLALALPDGELPPGGTTRGFVYFERAPRGVGEVRLTAPVADARTGETLGVVSVPLTLP